MDGGYMETLQQEYEAADGSFLIEIRTSLYWDKGAFSRLTAAMKQCCLDSAGKDRLDRWLAELFWYLSDYVRAWTTHPNFPRTYSQEYYEKAYERLYNLAYWYFRGYSPYIDDARFDDPL